MSNPITVVSSKATQAVLTELCHEFELGARQGVRLESVGGVDAARRVRAGELFDVVVLARGIIDELESEGQLCEAGKRDLVHSAVAVAVRRGAARPDITTEAAVQRAVLAARSIGLSTGPSGVAFSQQLDRWGIGEEVRARLVVAPPGVPVAALLARGEVELGFQQLSELVHADGVDVIGSLPAPIAIITTFTAAIGARSERVEHAQTLIEYLASPATADAKRRQGMDPA